MSCLKHAAQEVRGEQDVPYDGAAPANRTLQLAGTLTHLGEVRILLRCRAAAFLAKNM